MKYWWVGFVVWLCVACAETVKAPVLHDFGPFENHADRQETGTVNVDAPTWLWDNRIRYRLLYDSSTQIGFYGLDRWLASPPEMFEQLLLAGGQAGSRVLKIELQEFEQQFDNPTRAKVVMRFSAVAFSADYREQLGAKSFYLQHSNLTPDASGAIRGFTELTQSAAEKIRQWVLELNR